MTRLILSLILAASVLLGQTTINGGRTITGAWDASGATTTKPMKSGTSLPGTCAVGETFYKTDATAGSNIYGCTATNTWTPQGGSYTLPIAAAGTLGGVKVGTGLAIDGAGVLSASGGSSPSLVNPRYVQISEDFGVPGTSQTGNAAWRGSASVWTHTGSGNIGSYQAGTWPNLGVVRQVTGTGGGSQINQSDITNTIAWGTLPTNQTWAYYLVFRFPAAQDYDAQAQTWLMVGGAAGTPPNGFGIRRTAAETTWQLVFKSGDGTQVTDSGWAANDTNWHTLKIRADGTTTNKVWVSLDGGTEKSICVSGCDANAGAGWWGNPTLNGFYVANYATATYTRNFDLDYFGFQATVYTSDGRRQ